jgi:hypothetical protein
MTMFPCGRSTPWRLLPSGPCGLRGFAALHGPGFSFSDWDWLARHLKAGLSILTGRFDQHGDFHFVSFEKKGDIAPSLQELQILTGVQDPANRRLESIGFEIGYLDQDGSKSFFACKKGGWPRNGVAHV